MSRKLITLLCLTAMILGTGVAATVVLGGDAWSAQAEWVSPGTQLAAGSHGDPDGVPTPESNESQTPPAPAVEVDPDGAPAA